MKYIRDKVVTIMQNWIGKNEDDGSHKSIIDIYNTISPLPVGYKVKYSDAWCAATVSAAFHLAEYDAIFPAECGCDRMIDKAKAMGIWVEDDAYVPKPGDCIMYCWSDDGIGDNTDSADHVGMVETSDSGKITVIEGNKNDAVERRYIAVNSKFIRGYICPKFDSESDNNPAPNPKPSNKKSNEEVAKEVILGKWGNGDVRESALTEAGYDYNEVQAEVNKLLGVKSEDSTVKNEIKASNYARSFDSDLAGEYKVIASSGLYLRNGAGTWFDALTILPYGTRVTNYGYYTMCNGEAWLYVEVYKDDIRYVGFCHSKYLTK